LAHKLALVAKRLSRELDEMPLRAPTVLGTLEADEMIRLGIGTKTGAAWGIKGATATAVLAIVDLLRKRQRRRQSVSLGESGYDQLREILICSNAAFSPSVSFFASPFAQKCMKKSRGSSSSMWL
jgi:hypothetical protein